MNTMPMDANVMGRLVSVNVALPQDLLWQDRTVHTGLWKKPVSGARLVKRLNIEGDGQGDLAGHGGENRAVLVYQLDSYRFWQEELGRSNLEYGTFGENFTVDGLSDDHVCIGDRFRIGEAVFEVSQPRVTCYRAGIRIGEPELAAKLVTAGRPGFYFRVLQQGEVQAGDAITRVGTADERMSVADIDALLYRPRHARDKVESALRIPALSPGWRHSFQSLLDQTGGADGNAGNAGLTASVEPPLAWRGFRNLRVLSKAYESTDVISLVLGSTDGRPLPKALPGQFIALH
jgi:MOSC domain-containing protein YiiM